ncbi:MAG: hypothetical protein ACTSUX_02000 [Promethearchaeota archaeon]
MVIVSFIPLPLAQILKQEFNIYQNKKLDLQNLENVKTSDVAGRDLYAESIDAYVSGKYSLIKQSLITNDTNIISQFDIRDPAFQQCSFAISVSNGIVPKIYPRLLIEEDLSYQYSMTFNQFSGFLYYNESVSQSKASKRAERAIEIIQNKFEVDLIKLNVDHPNLFVFVGYYPDWKKYFSEILPNIPMDGFWKALNVERLTSKNYYNSHHLSSTILHIESLDFLNENVLNEIKQVNFNLKSLELSRMNTLQLENTFQQFQETVNQLTSLNENTSSILQGNNTNTNNNLEALSEIFKYIGLSNNLHYFNIMVQYEGQDEGITYLGNNQYSFNLWKAMGYQGEPLRPSEKTFIALAGAFMSKINIKIACSDIIDVTPSTQTLYDFLIEQVGLILFYMEVNFDVNTLKDYVFKTNWLDVDGIKEVEVLPFNVNNSYDYVNFLPQIGVFGVPGISAGLFNPYDSLIVKYEIANSEPNLMITKEILNNNATYGVYNNFDFNITAKNVGNETAWGVPTYIPFTLDDVFTVIAGPLGPELQDAIWEIVKVEYRGQYDSLEDFFNFDEDPRIFYFDTYGYGAIDTYYPDLTNTSNLFPYNENMNTVIDILVKTYPQLTSALIAIGLTPAVLKEIFTNKNSIWNDENWKLTPGSKISYLMENFSISNLDSFTNFYSYNFTIKNTPPQLPAVISGISYQNTDPSMALKDDNQSWIILSEEKYVNAHEIEIYFIFQNNTNIDLVNNSLDRVSIVINMTDPSNNINFEIFNFSTSTFQDMSPYLSSTVNNTLTFTFTRNKGSLEWMFDPNNNNHTILIHLKGNDNQQFNISINDFNVEFAKRDVNEFHFLGSRVIYSTESGNIRYIRKSNSISLSTYDMASLIAFANITQYNSCVGNESIYTLKIENIGSEIAKNVNVSILIPGIISNGTGFAIKENRLEKIIPEIAPSQKIILNFSFIIPNTIKIGNVRITYNNTDLITNINSSELLCEPNEVFITAKVDFEKTFPLVRTIAISYNASTFAPTVGQEFNVTIKFKNLSHENYSIPKLAVTLNPQYGDLVVLGNKTSSTSKTLLDKPLIVKFNFKKDDWKGYYVPPINYLECEQLRTLQINSSKSLILGTMKLTINKSINKNQLEVNDIALISITVKNTGNICIENIDLSDVLSFNQLEFKLIKGKLVHEITCLEPNESITFNYTIRAVSQRIVTLEPAFIEYYFLNKVITTSNTIEVKIILQKEYQLTFVLIPSTVGLVSIFAYLINLKKRLIKKRELRRKELIILTTTSLDAILHVEKTLAEELINLAKNKQ